VKVVGFLQNPWSELYSGGTWPRESWLKALQRSRSGQRLRVLEAAVTGIEFWWDNTTPLVAESPDGVLPPDEAHIRQVLREQQPDVVVTFGEQARKALLPLWHGPMVCLPHPAYRVVTNVLFESAAPYLASGRRIRLIQQRGMIAVEEVPKCPTNLTAARIRPASSPTATLTSLRREGMAD
jgi:hypothetical protein